LDPKGGRIEDMDDMMLRVRVVAATLKDFQALLEADGQLDRALGHLAGTAGRTVPAAAVAGVTLLAEDTRVIWAATSDGRPMASAPGERGRWPII
jgi:hypothetical protein